LFEQKCFSKNAVLVGDSVYDKNGAEIARVDFLGVIYDFGIKKGGKTNSRFDTVDSSVELSEYFKIK
jgi:hypothetical protein